MRSAWPLVLVFTGFIAATYGFGVYLFAALVPAMRHRIGFALSVPGDIAAAQWAGYLVACLFVGALVARFGAGRVVLIAVAIACVCLACMAAASNVLEFAVLLTAMNASAVLAWTPMVAVVARSVPPQHRGKALGLIASGTSYGVLANGLALAPLAARFGWRAPWLVAAALTACLLLAAISLLAGRPGLRERPGAQSRSGLRQALAEGWPVFTLAIAGGMAGWPFLTYWSLFAEHDLNLSPAVAAQAWALVGLVGLIGGFAWGALADRFGLRRALWVTSSLLCASGLLMASNPGMIGLFCAAVCFGASFNPTYGLLAAVIAKTGLRERAATLAALVNGGLGIGALAGEFFAARVIDRLGTARPVYVATACLGAAMLGLVWLLPRRE